MAIDSSQLALQRTVLAAERTFLAWVRTAISMFGFGFSIYKFFEYLRQAEGFARPHAPRNLGLTLIALGTLTIGAAAWQYVGTLRGLGVPRPRVALSLAVVLCVIGALMFTSIYLGTGPF